MSHFSVWVEIPRDTDVETAVRSVMAPFQEGLSEEYHGEWDWYVIGGRWTGRFDGYDPEKDPENIESCFLCHGTGTRTDMTIVNGCNGCEGKGKKVKWPTDWKAHSGDIQPASVVAELLHKNNKETPYAFIRDEEWYQVGGDSAEVFVWLDAAEERNRLIVLVDCHT